MKMERKGEERKGHSDVDGCVEASWHFVCMSVCPGPWVRRQEAARVHPGQLLHGGQIGPLEDGTMTMTTPRLSSPLHVPRSFPPALDPALKGDTVKAKRYAGTTQAWGTAHNTR
jgi:hypothetical protein